MNLGQACANPRQLMNAWFACLVAALSLSITQIAMAQEESADDADAGPELSAECAAFAQDKDADLGDVLRAGCQPTLAQMSALMDNPLGNVAMSFFQYDQYFVTRDDIDQTANQGNFMGILQFPKGLGENWNLINRVVYNIPSVPLDQDKIDAGAPTDPPECFPPPGGGLLVQHVAEGSLAEQFGLRPSVVPAKIGDLDMLVGGDIIVMVQGIPMGAELENIERIYQTIAALPDGATILVTVLRAGEQVVLSGPFRR